MTDRRQREIYLAAAVATMLLGLWVHRGGAGLQSAARDIAGDAIWAAMIAWGVAAVIPTRPLIARSVAAFGLCAAVEVSQLVHTPTLDAWRASTLGALVLGSGFDPRDLASYAIGIVTAAATERIIRSAVTIIRR
jgi:hypothetical protein